jgi:hypothetical protein
MYTIILVPYSKQKLKGVLLKVIESAAATAEPGMSTAVASARSVEPSLPVLVPAALVSPGSTASVATAAVAIPPLSAAMTALSLASGKVVTVSVAKSDVAAGAAIPSPVAVAPGTLPVAAAAAPSSASLALVASSSSSSSSSSHANDFKRQPRGGASRAAPVGAHQCLAGLVFVTTGQVDALESDDELETLIRRHGGRMSYVVSGKTSFLVAGHESSEAKLAAARELNVRILDADGLFELIRTSPEGGVAAAADALAPGEIGTVNSMIKRPSLCESPCFCDLFGQFYTYCLLLLCAHSCWPTDDGRVALEQGRQSVRMSCIFKAKSHFQRAVDLGNADACGELGWWIHQWGTAPADVLQLAARGHRNGSAIGTSALAQCYLSGNGVDRNAERGARLARMAADAGDARGMHALAAHLEKVGAGDEREWLEWYRRAASLGHAGAMERVKKYEARQAEAAAAVSSAALAMQPARNNEHDVVALHDDGSESDPKRPNTES